MNALRYLNKYFFKYKFLLAAGVFFIICSNIFAILAAPIVRTAVDTMADDIRTYSLLNIDRDYIMGHVGKLALFFGALVLGSAILKGSFMYFMRQTIIVMSRYIEYDLKNEIYAHYQKLDATFYNKNYTGDLMNRISEDVSRVRMYLGPAVMYTINLVVLFILVISVMASIHPQITLYVLTPLPILSISIYFVSEIINKRSDVLQRKLSDITTFVQEAFSGIRVIKSFAAEKWFKKAFEAETESYRLRYLDLVKVNALFFPLTLMLVGLSVAITIYTGGKAVINGTFSFGNIAEYVIYVNMLTWPVASLGWVTSIVQRAEASQNRINEFLNTVPSTNTSGTAVNGFSDQISFKNVCFSYTPNNEVLHDISFELKKGESLGIIGTTGSGKSTIARLLLQNHEANSGQITIDGLAINELELKKYLNLFGYVPQDIFLFSDTIANNISFGLHHMDPEKDIKIKRAAEWAEVHGEIDKFPKKYETILGERGISLSGGQKQRVAIARALARDPEILLFDDCLSAVDTSTEARIKRHLKDIMNGKTSIIISHRVSSVDTCDQIIVLDEGYIVERGTMAELIELNGLFGRMVEMQQLEESIAE